MDMLPGNRRNLLNMKSISEINLTPLMDLTFILLITFIITFPLIEQGVTVNLPSGQGQKIEPGQATTITVDLAGTIHLENRPVTEAQLREELALRKRVEPDLAVLLRGDTDVAYGQMVKVLNALQSAGIYRVALVNQAEPKS